MDVLTQSNVITLCSLGFAIVLVGGAYIHLRRSKGIANVGLMDGMGGPSWDFSQSWATTLATVGGVLNTVFAAGVLVEVKVPSGLGAFFGILALLGPFAFSALLLHRLRTNEAAAAVGDGLGVPHYEGCVAGFLVACLLTIWGASGELATTITLCVDLAGQGALSWVASVVLAVCLGLAVVGIALYAWRTIPATIVAQRDEMHKQEYAKRLEENRMTLAGARGMPAEKVPYADVPKPPWPRWTLL